MPQNQNTIHDHFLQCNSHRGEKKKWVENLRTALSQHFTPLNFREAILDRLFNYYDSNLRDSNKVDFKDNHSYESRSDSDEKNDTKQGQRRIIDNIVYRIPQMSPLSHATPIRHNPQIHGKGLYQEGKCHHQNQTKPTSK